MVTFDLNAYTDLQTSFYWMTLVGAKLWIILVRVSSRDENQAVGLQLIKIQTTIRQPVSIKMDS